MWKLIKLIVNGKFCTHSMSTWAHVKYKARAIFAVLLDRVNFVAPVTPYKQWCISQKGNHRLTVSDYQYRMVVHYYKYKGKYS